MKYSFIDLIKSDLARYGKASFYELLKQYFLPRGGVFRYTFWLRAVHAVKKNSFSRIFFGGLTYLIFRHYEYKYGIHINTNLEIGRGLKIVHGDCVYLNCRRIGDNATIFQGVTLGANGGSSNIPIVGNNVTLCVGAVIVGDITLNDGCTVGANAFVNHDVKENDVVGGVPARSIKNEGRANVGLLNYST